jgi:hypothetical protein
MTPQPSETFEQFVKRATTANPPLTVTEALVGWREAKSIRPEQVVKFTRKGVIGAYGIIWGSPAMRDLTGEFFDEQTDFMFDVVPPTVPRPLLMEHGFDDMIRKDMIGTTVSMTPDDFGIWVESKLDERKKYREHIARLIEEGALSYSTGSAPQLVQKTTDGRIEKWGIIEASLTTTPAEPRLPDLTFLRSLPLDPKLKQFVTPEVVTVANLLQETARRLQGTV